MAGIKTQCYTSVMVGIKLVGLVVWNVKLVGLVVWYVNLVGLEVL